MSTTTQQIKLSLLEKSQLNARKTISEDSRSELKASLLAHGLLQNLVVVKKGEKYLVIAGGRRLDALKELAKENKIGNAMSISCEVVPEDTALEMSIAENTIREEMHPADEFEAYAALIKKGIKPDAIAMRFGVKVKHVMQRLKLGQVAPEIMKAFRAGKIGLDSLMAFTLTDDQKVQLDVFKSLKEWERRNANAIKDRLMKNKVPSSAKLARFVTVDAYKKAGGKMVDDLFAEGSYLEDSTLLSKLAADKLAAEADRLKKEGWGWVEVAYEKDHEFIWACEEVVCKTKEQKSAAGCYVSINYEGKIDIEKGLSKTKKSKKVEKTKEAKSKKKSGDISQALRIDLEGYRMQVAHAEVASSPQLAFDMVAFKAIGAIFNDARSVVGGIEVSFNTQYPSQVVRSDKTKAYNALSATAKGLNMKWAEEKVQNRRFELFCELKQEEKLKLLAFATAHTIKASLSDTASKESWVESAYGMLDGANVAAYWRPTKDNYLSRITSDQIVAIGKFLFGDKWTPKSHNKSFLVTQFHDIFADAKKAANGDMGLQERIENWLPAGMAFAVRVDTKKKKKAA